MPKPRDPAPFSHLYGKKVRNLHTLKKCPMHGCDNCQCLFCGQSLTQEESNACKKCARDNDLNGYTTQEIDDWFVSLQKLHAASIN